MHKTLFIAATLSLGFVTAPAMAGDMNQPQDHRSTINQQQHNQVGQPIDNRIDSEVKQNQSNTPVNPPTTRSLPVTPPSRSLMTPEPPPPPTRVNPQTPQRIDPAQPDAFSSDNDPLVPDTTYPDDVVPPGE